MTRLASLTWIALLAGGLLVGCDSEEPTEPEADVNATAETADEAAAPTDASLSLAAPEPDTPEQAVMNLSQALQAGDKDAFMTLLHRSEEHPNLAAALFHFGHAATAARNKVADAGEKVSRAAGDVDVLLKLPYAADQDQLRATMTTQPLGEDAATVTVEGEDTLPLVRVGQQWKVDLLGALQTGTEEKVEKARASLEKAADEFGELARRIEADAKVTAVEARDAFQEKMGTTIRDSRAWLAEKIAPESEDASDEADAEPTPAE